MTRDLGRKSRVPTFLESHMSDDKLELLIVTLLVLVCAPLLYMILIAVMGIL